MVSRRTVMTFPRPACRTRCSAIQDEFCRVTLTGRRRRLNRRAVRRESGCGPQTPLPTGIPVQHACATPKWDAVDRRVDEADTGGRRRARGRIRRTEVRPMCRSGMRCPLSPQVEVRKPGERGSLPRLRISRRWRLMARRCRYDVICRFAPPVGGWCRWRRKSPVRKMKPDGRR